jgi:predicted PurR-regulated permease PerM
MNNNSRVTIDIAFSAILKVFGTLLGLWFLYTIRDIVLLMFLVIIIVMALDPIVLRLQTRMSRPLAVALLFVLIFAVLFLIIGLLMPPLIAQISDLATNLPMYANHLHDFSSTWGASQPGGLAVVQQVLQSVANELSNASRGVISATLGFLGGLVSFLTIVVLSAYMLLEEKGIRNFIMSLVPFKERENIVRAINKIGDKLGAWLRGQLLLMLIIGIMATVWTIVLGLPYNLPLGLWAGLTEAIPFLGPILGGIPIVLIAFLDSPIKALVAAVLLLLTQQVESNFIVPNVMRRSVGLSPVIVILALLIGGKLFGIAGTILSVPVAATVSVIIQEWPRLFSNKKEKIEE